VVECFRTADGKTISAGRALEARLGMAKVSAAPAGQCRRGCRYLLAGTRCT